MKPKKPMVQNQVTVLKCLADAYRIPDRKQLCVKKTKNPAIVDTRYYGNLGTHEDYTKTKAVNITKLQNQKKLSLSDSSAGTTSTHTSSRVNTPNSAGGSAINYHNNIRSDRRVKRAGNEVLKRCKLSKLMAGNCENCGAFNNMYVTKTNSILMQVTKHRKLLSCPPAIYPPRSKTYKRPVIFPNQVYKAVPAYASQAPPVRKQPAKLAHNERGNFRYNDRPAIPMWACHSNTKIIASKHILRLPQKQKKRSPVVKKRKKKRASQYASSTASTIKFKYISKDATEADVFIKEFKKKLREAKMRNRPPKVVHENKLRPLIYHTAGPPVYVWSYGDIIRKMK
ncbi:uncharacterized protein LOC119662658 [Teleopsis dalmanni]|uniref:uncharacterized protein LOC119662658 n=1 Tax=Teleopsis dalmanni TaxID=139649 RepID=UPI0018CE92DC|nr:uncharacterized protein LOC119662658 [Teleopsis dalmanni]